MNLSTLPTTTKRSKKRVGRGYGSGKGGHTSGRGTKGQKARNKVPLLFEGAAMGASLIKRLPLLRGKGKLRSSRNRPLLVNIKYLQGIPPQTTVDIATLIRFKIVNEQEARQYGVKLLGDGEISHSLTITIPTSRAAQKKIEKAGGAVVTEKSKTVDSLPKKEKKPVSRSAQKQ
ncbi:50S ribosomal protein L15 [Candidatus Roizmanbacteria bacterium]|nr:50S ribosomal protein L15 [Candidatus Roizmanbacteria bacterium]